MKIGLDLSVIQTPHRMRGIGATAINFVNNISEEDKKKHSFVFFLYPDEQEEALSILNLEGIHYYVRDLSKIKLINLKLPSKLRRLNGPINSYKKLRDAKNGDPRILMQDLSDLDSFLQFDQMQATPSYPGLKTGVILYDLIPYVLEADYLWSYKTARLNGDSRKSSLRKSLLRKRYIKQLKLVCSSADKLIAISNHTKKDFIKYLSIPESKIYVVYLGINKQKNTNNLGYPGFEKYEENAWGYFPKPTNLQDKPFILFVGGADPRRKLTDLVGAYNNLRAQGKDIRLVLAGDTMKGPKAIPVADTQKYLLDSSYDDNIYYLGFITDEQREWLYQNALAMVYPSVYEGFGLPILEAMQYGTPVITYPNTSILEVAEDAAAYADGMTGIAHHVKHILDKRSLREKLSQKSKLQASKFSWPDTVSKIMKELI